jgi:hypothetical protein
MRPILIAAGVGAAVIVAVAGATLWRERRAPVVAATLPSSQLVTVAAAAPPPALTGVAINGGRRELDISTFAVGDPAARAVFLGHCPVGGCVFPLSAGEHDLCIGDPAKAKPSCQYVDSTQKHPPRRRGLGFDIGGCDPSEPDCKCTPPDDTRSGWRGNCQRVVVADHMVDVRVGHGTEGVTFFYCQQPSNEGCR